MAAAEALLAQGYGLLVTASRRTPTTVREDWHARAKTDPKIWLHDGDGPNPYFAFLGAAEVILVTEDSTNMLTEACATGRRVYRLPMAGSAGKFERLYEALHTKYGVTRWDGQVEPQDHPPLRETARVAKILRERLRGET